MWELSQLTHYLQLLTMSWTIFCAILKLKVELTISSVLANMIEYHNINIKSEFNNLFCTLTDFLTNQSSYL